MALHTRSDSIQTHRQILLAACSLAIQSGPNGLTIDGVAKEAGMSKGGVLYHFPSKEALILGLMKLHFSSAWEGFRAHWKADPRVEGRWHRAWIRSTFEGLRRVEDMENAALFATVTSNPELSAFLRRKFARIQTCLGFDGLDPHWSRLLVSSVVGLRYDRLFRFCSDSSESLEHLEQNALVLLEEIVQLKTGHHSQIFGN